MLTLNAFSGCARRVALCLAGLAATAAAMLPERSHAQDLEPRQYSNVPIGLNFLVAGYARSHGSVLFDPSIELENAAAEFDGPVLGYARSIAAGRRSSIIDVGLAHVCLDGAADFRGERAERHVCGLSDARMRYSVNFYGAPAYDLFEFGQYRQDLVIGTSFTLVAPTGQYNPENLVNIGTNRWAAKLELGASKVLGRWLIEGAMAGTFFQDNDEFFGGDVLSQDPMFSLQVHFVRLFSSGVWLAVDATKYHGGKTTTDGQADRNRQSNARLGLTLSLPVGRRQSLKLYASSGVSTRTGTDFDTAGIGWQYRWGAGLPR